MSKTKHHSLFAAMLAAGALTAGAAGAHHSFAMFDTNPEAAVSVTGEVVAFQWTNPHAFIVVNATGDDGEVVQWAFEMNSPNNLARQGWKRTTLSVGDIVTVEGSPLRTGEPGALFRWVLKEDGEFIVAGSAQNVTPPPGVEWPAAE